MRALLQRVSEARVRVGERVVGEIGAGLLILLGVGKNDGPAEVAQLVQKIVGLRIFEDEQGKMNRSLADTGGAALVVSQFTLFADCRKGRRPFFGDAMAPEPAAQLCDELARQLAAQNVPVQTGEFGAMMQVELVNDGPVTIWLDTEELNRPRRG